MDVRSTGEDLSMKHDPEKPQEQEESPTEEQKTCSDTDLEQVSGGQKTRQKGSAPGFSPGTAINA